MESSEEEFDLETEVDLAELKKGDGLLDFLVQQKIKDRDVSLCPRCNVVFDVEAAAIFEKERMKKELAHKEKQARQRQPIRETCPKENLSPTKLENGNAIAHSPSKNKGKEANLDEEYFEKRDNEMVGTISIIPTEYLGKYEGDPEEDYDMEAEEAFSFIRYEDEPGYFLRPTEKQKSHLRPLHITTTLSGIKVNKVLIDGGTAISLLPERMLMKVGKHPDDLVPTNIAVTDFSGSSTPAKGLVTLRVKVGSSEQNTMFVVVPSKASYNALLGRDWIHGVEAIPSTMHQSVLLWTEDGKPEIVKVDLNLYVEQLHVDFRVYSPKLKPLNVDKALNSFNCEGCYLSSEGLTVKLRHPHLDVSPTGWDCLS
ncbi:hypothetical protein Ahy_A03g012109 [Arachis hypogaea]|uniref:Peptidase A2 domain-containing protein n=1 Tax=Arachis hypogaea TaxID=3818 RepID=A0A445DSL1_ARAHY|nr:hypothetical protein Ahy_A03g012109 [Arachis hypogaea]